MDPTEKIPWLGQYILDERGNPMPATSLLSWAKWLETHERHLALTTFAWGRVSTVFLGLDHNFYSRPENDPLGYKPVLWETMVFVHPGEMDRSEWAPVSDALMELDQEQRRYSSQEEALLGHREMVERCREAAGNEDDRIALENIEKPTAKAGAEGKA
jgi:hypothetical protein